MKRIASALLALTLCLGLLAGCDTDAPSPQQKSTILLGVSVYDGYDAFISVIMSSMRRYARALEAEHNVTITIQERDASSSQLTQNADVEYFVAAGCDIICVNLVDRTEASNIIDQAETAGIPVLFFNRELVEEDLERWEGLYYVGGWAEQCGELQAGLLLDLLGEDFAAVDSNGDGAIQYVMLEGEAGHQDAIIRSEYTINTLTEAGYEMHRLGAEIANWSRAQAETKMNAWLALSGQQDGTEPETGWQAIEVVFANNDEMALGAVDALEKTNLAKAEWPLVLGVDGTPDGLAAVANGTVYGTVLNDSVGQAKALVDLAWALIMGTEMPAGLIDGKYIRLPHHMITAENVDEYLALFE